MGELVTEEDVPLLEALADITCSYDEHFTSFTLHFAFNENDYFSNSVRAASTADYLITLIHTITILIIGLN